MPNNTQQDIAFQPKTQGYSYSNSPKGKEKKSNIFFVLALEIFGLLFLFFVFLAVLNYFNILSLSSLYPNAFGFLPHKQFNNQKIELKANLLTDNPKFKNYTKLANQATSQQMLNFIGKIATKETPTNDLLYPNEIYGIFSGFDDKYIQVVTYAGVKNLSYKSNLDVSKPGKVEKSATSSGVIIGFSKIDNNSFFSKNMFGKILHMKITLSSPETVLQIYLSD